MGKIVATRSSGSAQGRKRAAVQSQRVTNVVQTDGMSQLRKEHADYVTPYTEGSRHGIHAGLARKLWNQMRRNQIAKLSQNSELGCGWFVFLFFTFVE
jgi:ribosomal protein S25